jgi:dTDP-4-amino-4,6-dideoxygalactose transaminase
MSGGASFHGISPVHVDFSDEDIDAILAELRSLLAAGLVSQGRNVDLFEREFASYVGARYAVALNSGSMAIEAAVAGAGAFASPAPDSRPARGEVLVPANTNFATWVSVLRGGHQPRLADVDLLTMSPSVETLAARRTGRTVGVVLVHMGGVITPDIDAIAAWCARENVWLIEDCAHAHGS